MANQKHVKIVEQGADAIAAWREEHPSERLDLRRAELFNAYLSDADLSGANMWEIYLLGADLTNANLAGAYLEEAKLERASLIGTVLDGATITNACLWETQRSGWSIKGIICEAVHWDEDGAKLTQYAPGEFERLYADTFKIKLYYEGGIDLIEVATVPALIKQIEDKYPGCTLRLQAIQEDAGGASATIAVDNLGAYDIAALEATTQQSQSQLRLALKENEHLRIKFEFVMNEIIPSIVRQPMTEINIRGNFQGNLLGTVSGGEVQMTYSPNDLADLRLLVNNIFDHRKEIGLPPEQLAQLEANVQMVQEQMTKQKPDHSVIREAGKSIRTILEGAVGNTLASGLLPALQQLLG